MLEKIGKYIGFCVCRRSCLICSPVIVVVVVAVAVVVLLILIVVVVVVAVEAVAVPPPSATGSQAVGLVQCGIRSNGIKRRKN